MKATFISIFFLAITNYILGQGKLQKPLLAYQHNEMYDEKTKTYKPFVLCGKNIIADTLGFFTMQVGCERDIEVLLGRYKASKDTFFIEPFNLLESSPFAEIRKSWSKNGMQKVNFFTADLQKLDGTDSSWVITFFKSKKRKTIDKTGTNTIEIKRGQYDGMLLHQLSKIFKVPIVFWLDKRYNYDIVLNLPKDAVNRYIIGAANLSGIAVIRNDSLYLNSTKNPFKIITTPSN